MQVMSTEPADPRWPKLLSLAVHEFRTPITVVMGYIRMLLKERAGPLSEQQRKLLEEADKSCGRLSGLVAEMSELSALEAGTAALNLGPLDLKAVVGDAIAALPELSDREVTVELDADGSFEARGDSTRLRAAVTAILTGLRRELVADNRLLVKLSPAPNGVSAWLITIGPPGQADDARTSQPDTLQAFNEWRGGSGLSLAIARRIITRHGGAIHEPPGDSKAGAVIVLPADAA
jgi:signal transduction histidine kinase